MRNYLFEFEEKKLPPAVVLATGVLIAIFTLGTLVRMLTLALF
ncbi:hypothetical protein [Natrialbaceae archaeon AArc-T1-2]|nr:hypothetical protein [Natrialbaceae archaeon AArc-T1-2]WIV67735.1 hypothetical protein QQ977_03110 [Natrialbaceae archaeon AArc-T1-2]